MYFKIRKINAKPDEDKIVNMSKMGDIAELRKIVEILMKIKPENQILLYKGKQLVNDQRIIDYDIQLNDIVQVVVRQGIEESDDGDGDDSFSSAEPTCAIEQRLDTQNAETEGFTSGESKYYKLGDPVDARMRDTGGWFESDILDILQNLNASIDETSEEDLIFVCKVHRYESSGPVKFKSHEIRPRSFYKYKIKELTEGMTVMINANIVDPTNRGFWFDFNIGEVYNGQVKGMAHIHSPMIPVEVKVKFLSEIMRIEKPFLVTERTGDGTLPRPPLRKYPFHCEKCKDSQLRDCNECGCRTCSKKDLPHKILLCDECDYGYHIYCLDPPLTEVPAEPEWYCPSCKTDDSEIVRAGEKLKVSAKKAKMANKKEKVEAGTSRDWGRGMACVGRTKECTLVPKDHYGPIPGVEVGTCWKFRLQVSEAGIHRPHVAGIHGRESDGAYSLVLSGGYEDDVDNGDEFFYTGSGGRDLSGNKRVSLQSSDQKLKRMNKALALNCNAKFNDKKGAEATDWKAGKPVRVVRNYKLAKHSKYAPKEGNRYDGIYKVLKYYPETGKAGFIVWRYLLRRDDASLAPWETGAPVFDMIYPPGFLEARAEDIEFDKREEIQKRKQKDISDYMTSPKKPRYNPHILSPECEKHIRNDNANKKLWDECTSHLKEGKKKFIETLTETFMCICCQEVVHLPVTTDCKHNICRVCLKRSFKAEIYNCPICRHDLGKDYILDINHSLSCALKILFPGYEAGR